MAESTGPPLTEAEIQLVLKAVTSVIRYSGFGMVKIAIVKGEAVSIKTEFSQNLK